MLSPDVQRGEPLFGHIFPKIETCQPCAGFGQQCGRGIAERSPKLKQTFTGRFWGDDSIQRARPISALAGSGGQGSWDTATLQGWPRSPVLALGIPQGMICNQNPWLGKSIGRSALAVKSALWLFPGVTTCSEHRRPAPCPLTSPRHMLPLPSRY